MVNKHILWQKENTTKFITNIDHIWAVIKLISVICMCLVMFLGCGEEDLDDPISNLDDSKLNLDDSKLNLDDKNVRAQIWAEALNVVNLQTREVPSGEKLYYAPDQQVPYTGWVKGVLKNDNSRGVLWQVLRGKKHGFYIEWNRFGYTHNLVKGFFENGKANELWTYYHYTEKGNKKEAEGAFKDGFKDGLWTYWYANGLKESEGSYKAGSKDGLWTYWYANGLKESEGSYKAGSKDGLWNYWNEQGYKYRELIQEGVKDIAFSPDGRTLAANFGSDENIWLWDVETGTLKHTFEGNNSGASSHTTGRSIAFSPDGRFLANGVRFDGLVKLWNVESGILEKTFEASWGTVEFSQNGNSFAIRHGSDVRVYQNGTWRRSSTMFHKRGVNCIAFSPDGRFLACGISGRWVFPTWDIPQWDPGEIYLWRVNTLPKVRLPNQPDSNVSILAFSPDGDTLVSVHWKQNKWGDRIANENAVYFWDVATKELKNSWKRTPHVYCIAFSPDGSAFASISSTNFNGKHIGDSFIEVFHWDLDKALYKYTIKWDSKLNSGVKFQSITFSPDGKTLASSSNIGIIRLWDVP